MSQMLLGGYTRQSNRGLHIVTIDEDTQQIIDNYQLIEEKNPTYFALSRDNHHLYTLSEAHGEPGVSHYRLENGQAELKQHLPVFPGNGCYISYDEDNNNLYLSDYHHGKVAVVTLDENGMMSLTDIVTHEGSGPHENQDQAHAHFIKKAPTTDYIYSCDLGTDEVHTYQLTNDNTLEEVAVLHAAPGTGPRHLAFHPSLPIAYLVGELDYSVTVLQLNEDGTITAGNSQITIPTDYKEFNSSSAIRLTKDARHLYVSNRGHNSISSYRISNDGLTLYPIETVATHADFPRDFNFSQDETFILVGHQKENKVTLFQRNKETGRLNYIDETPIDEMVCVEPLNG